MNVLTEILSRLRVSPEYTDISARLRISFTDCRVVTDALSHWVKLEKSDIMDRSEIGLWCCGCPGMVSYTPVNKLDLWGDLTGTCGGNTLADKEEFIWAEMLSVSTGVECGILDDGGMVDNDCDMLGDDCGMLDDDGADDVMFADILLKNDCGPVLDIPPGMATGLSCCRICCCPICWGDVSMLAPSYALSPDLAGLKAPAMTGAREMGTLCFKSGT